MPIPMRVDNCPCGSEAIAAFLQECKRVEQEKYLKFAESLLESESDFSESVETDLQKSHAIYEEYCRTHAPNPFVMELIHTARPEIPSKIEAYMEQHVQKCRQELMQKIEDAVGWITDIHGLQLGKDGMLTGMIEGENGKAFVTTTYVRDAFRPYTVEVRKL